MCVCVCDVKGSMWLGTWDKQGSEPEHLGPIQDTTKWFWFLIDLGEYVGTYHMFTPDVALPYQANRVILPGLALEEGRKTCQEVWGVGEAEYQDKEMYQQKETSHHHSIYLSLVLLPSLWLFHCWINDQVPEMLR